MSFTVVRPPPNEIRLTSQAVAAATAPLLHVDDTMIDDVITRARSAERRRSRLLLHRSPDELLHEMIIALPRDSCDIPHKNFRSGKSFHVLRGGMTVMVFSDDGTTVTPLFAEAAGRRMPSLVRLNDPYFHTIIPMSDYVVFVETNMGPFTGNEFAPWSPTDMTTGDGLRFAETLRAVAAAR
jgi:cupin fold WbuC family metalloprotein